MSTPRFLDCSLLELSYAPLWNPNIMMLSITRLYALLFGLVLATSVASADDLDIKLKSGIFRGVSSANGTEKWLGIRYAEPPVDSLRFKAPVPITKVSTSVQDSSTFGNACPQPSSSGLGAAISEDCLFLNVRQPCRTSWPPGHCHN